MARMHPRGCNSSTRHLAKVIKLSSWGWLTVEETLRALDISKRTVKCDWKYPPPALLVKELLAWR
jgi:hypothetical protein